MDHSEEYAVLQKKLSDLRFQWLILPRGRMTERLERRWTMTCVHAFFNSKEKDSKQLAFRKLPVGSRMREFIARIRLRRANTTEDLMELWKDIVTPERKLRSVSKRLADEAWKKILSVTEREGLTEDSITVPTTRGPMTFTRFKPRL